MKNIILFLSMALAAITLWSQDENLCSWRCEDVAAKSITHSGDGDVVLLTGGGVAYPACHMHDDCGKFWCVIDIKVQVTGYVSYIDLDLASIGLHAGPTDPPVVEAMIPMHNVTTHKDAFGYASRIPLTSRLRITAGHYNPIPEGVIIYKISTWIKL